MIEFTNITKGFGAQAVLADASLRINTGERVGVVGPNGAGKSTLFAILTGDVSPDKGTVTVPKNFRLGHMRQAMRPEDAELTLLEFAEHGRPELLKLQVAIDALEHGLHAGTVANRESALKQLGRLQTDFERQGGYTLRSRVQAALTSLGFSPDAFDQPLRQLSGGWQMRAELVAVLLSDPDILLLDEPSNYLDIPAVEWLQRFLKDFRGTLVMISHDRFLLNALTETTVEVNAGKVTRYPGPYDFYAQERIRRQETLQATQKNEARERERIERFIERFRAKNTKSSQVQSRVKMLEKLSKTELPPNLANRGTLRLPAPTRCGQEVARIDNASFRYADGPWVLREASLSIQRGDKIALVGLNGTGKTTLLRILAGHLKLTEGTLRLGHNVSAGYQSQDFMETFDTTGTVFEAAKARAGRASEQEIRNILGGFGFTGEAVEKPVSVLSGGERVRLAFARLLIQPPNFLLLDEPTTHLDIAARETLEEALRNFEGTVCIVSHDIEFVRHTATTILATTPPGITRYAGGYDYYHEKMQGAANAGKVVQKAPEPSQRQALRRARAELVQEFSRRRRPLQDELKKNEARIEALELEQKELADRMAAPLPSSQEYQNISRRLSALQEELTAAHSRWEELMLQLEEIETEFRAQRGEDAAPEEA